MKSFFLIIIISVLILVPLTMSQAALNLGQDSFLEALASKAGFQTTSVQSQTYLDSTIGKMIAGILTLIGVSFLALIIVSGFQWMTAQGNEENAKKAKNRVLHATIGLLIIISSYIISFFIYNSINSSITGQSQEFNPEPGLECINNSDCSSSSDGSYCDYNGATGYCSECLEDSHCQDSNKPKCFIPFFGNNVCGECSSDADCQGGESCEWGECEP